MRHAASARQTATLVPPDFDSDLALKVLVSGRTPPSKTCANRRNFPRNRLLEPDSPKRKDRTKMWKNPNPTSERPNDSTTMIATSGQSRRIVSRRASPARKARWHHERPASSLQRKLGVCISASRTAATRGRAGHRRPGNTDICDTLAGLKEAKNGRSN